MDAINLHKTALLVIDMQKDFYAEGGNAVRRGKPVTLMQALPEKINQFAVTLRKQGTKVVFTEFVYDPVRSPANYVEIVGETKNSNWMCEAGTEGAKLAGVVVQNEDALLEKLSYDCFAGTDLLKLLKEWQIENVVITGVRTEICILATAERSFAEGFRTFVISDLIGSYDNKQEVSDTVLKVLSYACYVVSSIELLERVK